MNVVITGMTMPHNCRECRFMETVHRLDGRERFICIAHLNEITNLKERLDTCPLIEANAYDMFNAILHSAQYKYGYEQALDDIIECMENGDLCEYVDPYEISGFMQCLKNAADKLKESKDGQTD